MSSIDRTHPSGTYTFGRVLGKNWGWVLFVGAALWVFANYVSDLRRAVRAQEIVAEERAAARAAFKQKQAASAAAAASAQAAVSPEQRAKEARAAAEAERAEAKKREARAKLDAKIEAMTWWNQCIAWGREVRSKKRSPWQEALSEHLTSERMLNLKDRMYVADRVPSVGMTTCGVYAQLGLPNDVNATTTAISTTVQLVYRDRHVYVYTRAAPDDGNGIVEAVQQ